MFCLLKVCFVCEKYVLFVKSMFCVLKVCFVREKYVLFVKSMFLCQKYVFVCEKCVLCVKRMGGLQSVGIRVVPFSWRQICVLEEGRG